MNSHTSKKYAHKRTKLPIPRAELEVIRELLLATKMDSWMRFELLSECHPAYNLMKISDVCYVCGIKKREFDHLTAKALENARTYLQNLPQ